MRLLDFPIILSAKKNLSEDEKILTTLQPYSGNKMAASLLGFYFVFKQSTLPVDKYFGYAVLRSFIIFRGGSIENIDITAALTDGENPSTTLTAALKSLLKVANEKEKALLLLHLCTYILQQPNPTSCPRSFLNLFPRELIDFFKQLPGNFFFTKKMSLLYFAFFNALLAGLYEKNQWLFYELLKQKFVLNKLTGTKNLKSFVSWAPIELIKDLMDIWHQAPSHSFKRDNHRASSLLTASVTRDSAELFTMLTDTFPHSMLQTILFSPAQFFLPVIPESTQAPKEKVLPTITINFNISNLRYCIDALALTTDLRLQALQKLFFKLVHSLQKNNFSTLPWNEQKHYLHEGWQILDNYLMYDQEKNPTLTLKQARGLILLNQLVLNLPLYHNNQDELQEKRQFLIHEFLPKQLWELLDTIGKEYKDPSKFFNKYAHNVYINDIFKANHLAFIANLHSNVQAQTCSYASDQTTVYLGFTGLSCTSNR